MMKLWIHENHILWTAEWRMNEAHSSLRSSWSNIWRFLHIHDFNYRINQRKRDGKTKNPWNKPGLQGAVNSTKFHTFSDCNSQTTAQKYCKIIIKNTTGWFIYSLFLKHGLLMYGFPYKWVIKQLWNSAFVLSEEFIWRSWVRVLSASSDNTVFNLRNTSDHT